MKKSSKKASAIDVSGVAVRIEKLTSVVSKLRTKVDGIFKDQDKSSEEIRRDLKELKSAILDQGHKGRSVTKLVGNKGETQICLAGFSYRHLFTTSF